MVGLVLVPVVLSLALVSGTLGWYQHKVDRSGARIVPEKTQGGSETCSAKLNESSGDHCPVHGEKKVSLLSRTDEKKVPSVSTTRSHKHSKSRHEH